MGGGGKARVQSLRKNLEQFSDYGQNNSTTHIRNVIGCKYPHISFTFPTLARAASPSPRPSSGTGRMHGPQRRHRGGQGKRPADAPPPPSQPRDRTACRRPAPYRRRQQRRPTPPRRPPPPQTSLWGSLPHPVCREWSGQSTFITSIQSYMSFLLFLPPLVNATPTPV